MKRHLKWLIVVGGLVAFFVIIFLIWRLRVAKPTTTSTTTVHQGTLVATVDFTGHLEATEIAKLGFETTGVAKQVVVDVGDTVQAGQRLAVLDSETSELEVAKAYADQRGAVATAQAGLAAAQSANQTTITANQKTIAQAQQAVRNAKRDLDQAKVIWDQTVRESGDTSSTSQTKYAAVLTADSAYKNAQKALLVAQTTADKSNAAAAAAVTTAQTALTNTLHASATSAGPSSLEALEKLARVRLSKTVLTAPFSGVITDKKIASGELAIGGTPLFTIQTTNDLQVIADVAETDVTQLQIGQTADITLDAYPSDQHWSAQVSKIAPSAVILSGVPTYQVTLKLTNLDDRLKPGLTTNIQVETQHKDNVLLIPRRAVTHSEGHDYVTVVGSDRHTEKREVHTGLTDSNGQIEIISGLNVGDTIDLRPVTSS